MQTFSFTPVGIIQSPYQQKFGIPRQPFLAPSVSAVLTLLPPFNHPDCVRGLAEFEYIWLQFVFHGNEGEGWAPLVRPPRLGGKKKAGVFATRSPHRPNPIGLSLVKLESISHEQGVSLHLTGADLLDGTPVLDIKPYIPFVEAKPEAKSGFVDGEPIQLPVLWTDQAQRQLSELPNQDRFKVMVEQSLAQDPRPAFHQDDEREYGMLLDGVNVKFKVAGGKVSVVQLETPKRTGV